MREARRTGRMQRGQRGRCRPDVMLRRLQRGASRASVPEGPAVEALGNPGWLQGAGFIHGTEVVEGDPEA